MGEVKHGTYSGYTNHKCRCDDCRSAAREYQRNRIARNRPEGWEPQKRGPVAGPDKHGTTNQYYNRGCRCDECREAVRQERSKIREVGLSESDDRHGTASGYTNWGCRCDKCREAHRLTGAGRKSALKANYGITPEQWDELWQSQGEVCASCGDAPLPDSKRRFHVDHNHDTGEVRGILCHGCNVALGLLKEDPERIRALAAYIE